MAEKEYIDRKAVIDHIDSVVNEASDTDYKKAAWGFGVFVSRLPAADVVPVVRCKDCTYFDEAHYEDNGEPPYIKTCCSLINRTVQPNDYCSYGKRKELNDDA